MEVLIVLGILTLGLLGIASLVMQNMQVENLTKNYLVASMLAQEGIEIVRNIRDENWLNPISDDPLNWLKNIPEGTFAIDYRGRSSVNEVPDVNGDEGTQLYLDGTGFYSLVHSIATTAFFRLITVEYHVSDDYFLITSDVMWTGRFGERHYTVKTALYNWR